MKKTTILLAVVLLLTTLTIRAQVAINTDDSDANASAMVDVKSTTLGFLPPRMTTAQRDAIVAPASGLMIYNTTTNTLNYYSGAYWSELSWDQPPVVTNATTGETWMNQNLGASQVATSSTDSDAYGDLYQWGRASDGHEKRNSDTTSTNATTATPNLGNSWDGKFIMVANSPGDWLVPQNNNLWQGVAGTNNPCPAGFRVPTSTELDTERLSWATNDLAGAYGSNLKLTASGTRFIDDGFVSYADLNGFYFSSTVNGTKANTLTFSSNGCIIFDYEHAFGMTVRCIKD